MPKEENPTFEKVDDNSFYLSKTVNELYSIDALQAAIAYHDDEIARIQKQRDDKVALLQGAVGVSVANARPALATVAPEVLVAPVDVASMPVSVAPDALAA